MASPQDFLDLADVIRAELAIERATTKAFKAWLPAVVDAVLHGKAPLLAAADDEEDEPVGFFFLNPDAAELTRDLWAAQVAVILVEVGKVFDQRFAAVSEDLDVTAAREAYLASVRERLLAIPDAIFVRVQDLISQSVLDGVPIETIAERVQQELKPTNPAYVTQAYRVGRTEGIGVYNGATFQAWMDLARRTGQSFSKTWTTVKDTRVRHTHQEAGGQRVALAAKFYVGGFVADYPGDPRLPVQEAANCRCIARYSISNSFSPTPVVAGVQVRNERKIFCGPRAPGVQGVKLVPDDVLGRKKGGPFGHAKSLGHRTESENQVGLTELHQQERPNLGDQNSSLVAPPVSPSNTIPPISNVLPGIDGPTAASHSDNGVQGPDVGVGNQHGRNVLVADASLPGNLASGQGDTPVGVDHSSKVGASHVGHHSTNVSLAGMQSIGEKMNEIVASIDEAYATDGALPNGWRGPMAPLNHPTGDGRQLNVPEGGVRTRELPITFDWAPSREGGHDGAVMAGRIDHVWVEGDMLWGEGAIDTRGYNGAEYARQLADGFAMFVSVDPDEVTFETQFFNEAGDQVQFSEAVTTLDGAETLKEGYTVLDVMTDWRLAGVTAVTIPAFQEARISPVYDYKPRGKSYAELTFAELMEEMDLADGEDLVELARTVRTRLVEMAGDDNDSIVAAVTGNLGYPIWADRKRKWDGHTARQNVAKWASSDGSGDPATINKKKFQTAFLWVGEPNSGNALDGESFGDKDPKKATATWNVEDAKGGIADIIDGKPYIVANAVIGLAGGHGIQAMSVPGPAKKAMLNKLKKLYGRMKTEFPDFPEYPFSDTSDAELVAAAGQVFELNNFENPGLTRPTPLTVKDGKVYGHVALFDSCYMAQGGARACIKPPKGGDYSRFLTHGARLGDGEVLPVGMLTFGEGHFAGGSLRASMANYANLATGAAKVNVGEDEFGVWVAGEVLAAFRDRADDLLLSPLSGHWEPDLDRGGALTLIAAHVVVTPGFHVPRLVATMGAEGVLDMAIVAGPFEEQQDAALVASVALRKLGLDPDSRASVALSRLGVRK